MSTATINSGNASTPDEAQSAGRLSAVDVGCRALDIVVAAIMLLLLLPVMVVIAVAIRLESRGPVIFRQRRVGRSVETFTVNKFRTMHHGVSHDVHRAFVLSLISGDQPAQADGNPRFKLVRDDRVTRVGRVLRRTSLDELAAAVERAARRDVASRATSGHPVRGR